MNLPLSTIREAQERLRRYLPVTRLVRAASLSRRTGAHVCLKLETELPTGSFKPRGGLYALRVNLERGQVREVTASGTGNHGAAVAYAAKLLGIPATICLPESPNPVKRARIAELGARIVEGGRDISDAVSRPRFMRKARAPVSSTMPPIPICPPGPPSSHVKSSSKFPRPTPSMFPWEAIRALVDEVCLVSDEPMLAALAHLLLEERIVAEPSGAATTAAVLHGGGIPVGRRVVLRVSGANVSPEVLRKAIGPKN